MSDPVAEFVARHNLPGCQPATLIRAKLDPFSEGMAEGPPIFYLCLIDPEGRIVASNWIKTSDDQLEGTPEYGDWLRANSLETLYDVHVLRDGGQAYLNSLTNGKLS